MSHQVEELKAKIFVAIKKFISRHFSKETKNDKLVTTLDTHVVTITRQLQQNYVATESLKTARNHVAIETISQDKI